MKTYSISALLAFVLSAHFASAQVNQGFEGGLTNLYNNCWQFSNTLSLTSQENKGGPIAGTESMITLPPVNEGIKDYLVTPYLDLSSMNLKVSFKYALNTKLAGSAYRLIRFGLIDKYDNVLSLDSIHMNKTTSLNIFTYSRSFILTSPVSKRFFIEFSGNTGDGNSRLIFDDLYLSADYYYGENGNNACNAAPVAVDDVYLGVSGALVSGNIKKNDTDPNGEAGVVKIITQPTDGELTLKNDGSFNFLPNPGFSGSKIEFTYQLNDNGYTPLSSNIATVTIDFSFSLLSCNLKNFQGKVNNDNVSLDWAVTGNEHLAKVEIEESINGRDFKVSSALAATGKSGSEQYAYTGKMPFAGKLSFRVKLTDINNQVSYSKVLSLQALASAASAIKFVSTDANKVSVAFQSTSEKVLNLRVVDLTGKVIFVSKQTASKGTNMFAVPISHQLVKGGVYFVQVADESGTYISKFLKG